jgi:hypothetical protein
MAQKRTYIYNIMAKKGTYNIMAKKTQQYNDQKRTYNIMAKK